MMAGEGEEVLVSLDPGQAQDVSAVCQEEPQAHAILTIKRKRKRRNTLDTFDAPEEQSVNTEHRVDAIQANCELRDVDETSNQQSQEVSQLLKVESSPEPRTNYPKKVPGYLIDVPSVVTRTEALLVDDQDVPTVDETSLADPDNPQTIDDDDNDVTVEEQIKKIRTADDERSLISQEILKHLPEPGIHTFTKEQHTELRKFFKDKKSVCCPKPGCKRTYKLLQSLKYHVTRCTGGNEDDDSLQTACEVCGRLFKSDRGYKYHLHSVHNNTAKTQAVPEESCVRSTGYVTRYGSRRGKKSISYFEDYLEDEVEDDVYEEDEEESDEVDEKSVYWKAYVKTVSANSRDEVTDIDTTSKAWKKQVEECLEILRNNYKGKKRKVKCPKNCGYSLTMVNKLNKHLTVCNGAARDHFLCTLCDDGRRFLSLPGIKYHISTIHKQMKDDDSLSESEDEASTADVKPRVAYRVIPARYYEETTEQWHRTFHSKLVHPAWKPTSSFWIKLPQSDIDAYLPIRRLSPSFKILLNTTKDNDRPDIQLPLFSATMSDPDDVLQSMTFYAGGTVWAMDWVPVPVDEGKSDQYLAIGCQSDTEKHHMIEKSCPEKGLLQIWKLPRLRNNATPEKQARFCLGVAYDYGPLWDMKWCPSGAWERPHKSSKTAKEQPRRLGLLALACGDGKFRILSVPFPDSLVQEGRGKDKDNDYKNLIFSVTPHAILSPGSLNRKYRGECGSAWSIAWQPMEDHKKVIGSFSDGTVAIWDLRTENVLLKVVSDDNLSENFFPISHFQAHISAVRSLTWCPSDPNYIATAAYDRFTKVWDLRHTSQPVSSMKKGLHYGVTWPIHGATLLYSCDITFGRTLMHGTRAADFFFNPGPKTNVPENGRSSICLIKHNSTAWDNSYSNWSNILASADDNGHLVMSVLGRFHTAAQTKTRRVRMKNETIFWTTFEEVIGDKNGTESNRADEAGAVPGNEIATEDAGTSRNCSEKNDCVAAKDYRLIFTDCHPLLTTKAERERLNKEMPWTNMDQPTYAALQKVCWNPNLTSYRWIAAAGRAGIVRVCYVGISE